MSTQNLIDIECLQMELMRTRLYWMTVGCTSKDQCLYMMRRGHGDTGGGHVKARNTEKRQEPQELGETRKGLP